MGSLVIPQDKANRLRNVSCEPVYVELLHETEWVISIEISFQGRFRIVEQYYAPRSVSRYCSNLRNDSLIAQNLVNLYIVTHFF